MSTQSDFQHHPWHYLSLGLILSIGFLLFINLSYYPALQLSVILAMSTSYVAWGIIHHWLHKDLHFKIVAEYALVAMFAILIFSSLLYRA